MPQQPDSTAGREPILPLPRPIDDEKPAPDTALPGDEGADVRPPHRGGAETEQPGEGRRPGGA